jgi:hypothetical protein
MALDKAFLAGVLEGITDEQVEKVLKEYESDVTGLKVNRDQVLTESKGYKEKLDKLSTDYGTEKSAFQKQIEDLETKLKASGSDELKVFHEAELKKTHDMYAAKIAEYEAKTGQHEKAFGELQSEYLEVLKNTELDKAMDKIQNLDRSKANILRDTFWGRNKFEHQTIEGVKKLMNQEYRSIGDVLNAFIATDEGKFFLLSNSTGGGATGSTSLKPQTGNPFIKGKENLTEQGRLLRENPTLYNTLKVQAEALNKGA